MLILLDPGLFPFLIATGLVVLLLCIEVLLLMFGLSSALPEADLGDVPDLDVDLHGMSVPELATELDVPFDLATEIEIGLAEADLPDASTDAAVSSTSSGSFDFLGLRKQPLIIWLAIFLALFAAAGLVLQSGMAAIFGQMLPRFVAVPLALIPSLALTRKLSAALARLIPQDETSAISERSLGRKRGVVTVGISRRGSPAQVRITDGYDNTHYAMLEPLADKDEIPEGTEVLVLRLRNGDLRLVPLG
ncbi:OB-fold-containig protein [Celeribacter sp.]|uniref:OB-fold-containig protein n=1 Tax=Celeribacter sp. TaxID=1890673 RepID=UPI003A90C930